MHHFFTEVLLC